MKIQYINVYPATLLFWLILTIFQKINNAEYVAMINPFTLRVLTLGKRNLDKFDTENLYIYRIPVRMHSHEMRHIYQVKSEGRIKFVVKYLWYNIKYGYHMNPYEIDARGRESD